MASDRTPFGRENAQRRVARARSGRARRRCTSRIGATLATTSVALLVASAAAATAAILSGGGSAKSDCLAVFEAPTVQVGRTSRLVRCTDGDACDADGLVNGRCELPIAVCANSTADPRCTLNGVGAVTVAHALDNGDPSFDPEMQALATRLSLVLELPETRADRCSAPTNLHLAIVGPLKNGRCRKSTKTVRLVALATAVDGRTRADVDHLKLVCDPAHAGCAPRAFFTSTFDRIQTQAFDQSCAVSGCHDSQTVQGELLLERGASYDNLVGAVPANADAAAAGWQRVTVLDAATGDPATSYLVHKLTNELGPGLGKRMPYNRPKLDDGLVEVIRRWVAAGAPADGWVPGTD